MIRFVALLAVFAIASGPFATCLAETLRHPPSLEQQLRQADPAHLARQARLRGDSRRGAWLFYTTPAACVKCHQSDAEASPLGPDLATLGEVDDRHVVESLLYPSKSIRKGYETQLILTVDGTLLSGLLASSDEQNVVLREASNLNEEITIDRADVDAIRTSDQSMMPEGLIASFTESRDFFDLVAYVMDVAEGGPHRAAELKPDPASLVSLDDTIDLDHAGIIRGFRSRDFEAGRRIYQNYCFNCHGRDGNTPSLPTARAFGRQPLRFGSDPYRMFLTLSKGNGLMSPMNHLTPKERYQVVHYVREQFMKPTNPSYVAVTPEYLSELPKGDKSGTEIESVDRDYGPALASQLQRRFSSVLTIRLKNASLAYNLHTMDQAGLWKNGFLDLNETQHQRDRGEGTANPDGQPVRELDGWRWGHEGTLDYSTDALLPRGPMPSRWMDYRGHYLHGDNVVLRYEIDGREIHELPQQPSAVSGVSSEFCVAHSMQVGPGRSLVLCVAQADAVIDLPDDARWLTAGKSVPVSGRVAVVGHGDRPHQRMCVAGLRGDIDGLMWHIDDDHRIVLTIPESQRSRSFTVIRAAGGDKKWLDDFSDALLRATSERNAGPMDLTRGGPLRWPDVLETTGTLGLSTSGYALDTLTLPDDTPWNTWFRTSAIDFFPDGRMVVTTYGGDVWIVSGVDQDLLKLRWKRFAGGLYEPFGVKVVDGKIYVTGKDRITRLHDWNDDGEADFYESFSADTDVSVNFHAFSFDLQVDDDGYLYYAKSGHGSDSEVPGCVVKVSPNGRRREIVCTGFRTPNGMGMLPGNRPTVSDNQGQWTPASKISQVRPGGFYGWVQTYSIPGLWEPGGGSIDVKKVVPPDSFDRPLVWMPQDFDNSSGGQLWVDDARWGPLSGHLLHTSFGKGWMSYLLSQEIEGTSQAAIIKLPFNFRTGIMRARVNPADGQVYATGLQGWNGGGRAGLLDGGIQRLRYLGTPPKMVTHCRVEPDGLQIQFNFQLDPTIATRPASYQAKQWNYRWRREYGSDKYSPSRGDVGVDALDVQSVTLGDDGKSVKLVVPNLKPVDQVHLVLSVQSSEGEPFAEEIYWTINRVPPSAPHGGVSTGD